MLGLQVARTALLPPMQASRVLSVQHARCVPLNATDIGSASQMQQGLAELHNIPAAGLYVQYQQPKVVANADRSSGAVDDSLSWESKALECHRMHVVAMGEYAALRIRLVEHQDSS